MPGESITRDFARVGASYLSIKKESEEKKASQKNVVQPVSGCKAKKGLDRMKNGVPRRRERGGMDSSGAQKGQGRASFDLVWVRGG